MGDNQFSGFRSYKQFYKNKDYESPPYQYFKTKEAFNHAVGEDFISHAIKVTNKGERFLVGLAHGLSPEGAYEYIIENYHRIPRYDLIRYSFVNSPLKRQRDLEGVTNAANFLVRLRRMGVVDKEQILGRSLDRSDMEAYAERFNEKLALYMERIGKDGFDYVFLATDPMGKVAAIKRRSKAFQSKDLVVYVDDTEEPEVTGTPYLLKKSKRIAFLATKSDKRRPLAWLFSRWAPDYLSPSFLRYMDHMKERLMVFIDDTALTWPQINLKRITPQGPSHIRLDLPRPYDAYPEEKLPVMIMIHGFLGLNSFDGLLTAIPSSQMIPVAMHYGSIPNDLPVEEYSNHIVKNIDFVIQYFGKKGHDVILFDHSMGNIYSLMMERDILKLEGTRKYLKGRIAANPFFGEEAKHAMLGFMDYVMLPSQKSSGSKKDWLMYNTMRRVVPFDTKSGVRYRAIFLLKRLVSKDSKTRDRFWQSVKKRILFQMTRLDSLPELNRIPIERALSRLPAKVFAIQVQSALKESKSFDKMKSYPNFTKYKIPILVLKSNRDGVAKFVDRMHGGKNVTVIDITNPDENDLFKEHLYHMIFPLETVDIVLEFKNSIQQKKPASIS